MRRRLLPIGVFMLVMSVALLSGRPAATQSESPTPSPELMAAARELVQAAHSADNVKTMLPLLMQQLKPAIVQGRANIEKDYDAIVPQLLQAMMARSDAFVDAISTVYAHNLTLEELQQLTAFYRSPIGQRFLEKMPVIFQESMAVGQKFGQEVALEARDHMLEELRKRGDIP